LAIFSYLLLFEEQNHYGKIETNLSEPIDIAKHVFIFLANAIRLSADRDEQITGSLIVGIIIFSMFFTMLFYHFTKNDHKIKSNLRPWFNISLFSFLTAIITAIGRVDYGVQQALANRYVPVSNLFLDGLIVITVVIIMQVIKNEKLDYRKKILKGILIIFLSLLALYILDSYISGWIAISGWVEESTFHNRLSKGPECLINYETSSDECLELLYPNTDILKKRAKMLEELCLGPFASNCKR